MSQKNWTSGDPCGMCGSRNTGWEFLEGAFCRDCNASDGDE